MNQQLLMALMQGAPAILSALKGTLTVPGGIANIENALQNGADPGIMGDQFNEIASRQSLTDGWNTPMSDALNLYELNKLYDTEPQDFPSFRASADDLLADLMSNTDVSKLSAQDRQYLAAYNNDSDMQDTLETMSMHNVLNNLASVVDDPVGSNYKIPDMVPAGFNADIPNQLGKRKSKYPAILSASSMLDALAQQRYKNDPTWAAQLGPQPYVK